MAGLLDRQPTRTHARAAGANSRDVTRLGIVCSFVSELFFRSSCLWTMIAVSTPTHKAQKRIYADGLDIDHRLPGHGHGTRRANESYAPFQMAWHREICSWRGGPGKCIAAICHITTPATAEYTQNWQHNATCARTYMRLHTKHEALLCTGLLDFGQCKLLPM